MKKVFYTTILISLISFQVNAQFGSLLKNAAKHAAEKAGGKIVNHMAEKGAEAVANKLINKWSAVEQEGMKKDYDSIRKADPDAYKDFDEYANSLNRNPKVKDEYHFDLYLVAETQDRNRKAEKSYMYYSEQSNLMGIADNPDMKNFTVIDYDQDIMVVFQEEDGEKKMQAVPSFQKYGGALAGALLASAAADSKLKVVKTGKTKSIAGYTCEEYKSTYRDGSSVAYMAKSFPIKWNEAYGKYMAQYMSYAAGGDVDDDAGMVLYSQSKNKKGKVKSTFEVKKVVKKPITIVTSEYRSE
jgi:hypothetical protein